MRPSEQSTFASEQFDFLAGLLEARGPSGFEDAPQAVFMKYVSDFADETGVDSYGNAWAATGPKDAPVVLVAGHSDEIGLIVSRIQDEGWIRFFPVGGVDPAVLVARRVYLQTRDGSLVTGVIGALPIHLQDRDKPSTPKIWDLYIDVGATSAEDVAAMGVQIGTTGTLHESWTLLPNERIVSRALDNRIGVFAAAETLRLLAAGRDALRWRCVAVSTVQEEIGAIGAEMITRRLQPQAALVVDVTHATDIPACNQNRYGAIALEKGPTVTHGSSNHRGLVQHIVNVAEAENIALQHEASNRYTGTDTDHIYRRLEGVPSALVSLPNRYMHTTAETSSLRDLVLIPRLLAATIQKLPPAPLASQLQGLA